MKILRIFDYVYYRVYHIYKVKWKDDTPGAYATSLITLLQNLLFVLIPIYTFAAIAGIIPDSDETYLIGGFILFFVFNCLRYSKRNNYESLRKRWNDESEVKFKQKGICVVLFIAITLAISITTAIIAGKIERGEL